MDPRFPDFRLGTELATSFTATLTERQGDALERMPTPGRLVEWLVISGFAVETCTAGDWSRAVELREAIHATATAAARGESLPASAVGVINDRSRRGRAVTTLTPSGERRWELGAASSVRDALGVIAVDAVSIIAGERDGRLALCASSTCQAAFFDTSRSRTRRWCDMNTCGNRQKKMRLNARRCDAAAS